MINAKFAEQPHQSLRDIPQLAGGVWAPVRTGRHMIDARAGRAAAAEVLAMADAERNPCLVAAFLSAVAESGMIGPAERGAFQAIGEALLA